MKTTKRPSRASRRAEPPCSPDRYTFTVENWQGCGFYGLVWPWTGKRCGNAYTLPHPNMRCPNELYATRDGCAAACRAKIAELEKANASLDRPAASAGTVGGVVGGSECH